MRISATIALAVLIPLAGFPQEKTRVSDARLAKIRQRFPAADLEWHLNYPGGELALEFMEFLKQVFDLN